MPKMMGKAKRAYPGNVLLLTDEAAARYVRWTRNGALQASAWLRRDDEYAGLEVWLIFPRQSGSGAQYGWRIELLQRVDAPDVPADEVGRVSPIVVNVDNVIGVAVDVAV